MAANTEKNTEIEIVRTDVIETELSADEAKKLDEAEVGAKLEKIGEIEASAIKTVAGGPEDIKKKMPFLKSEGVKNTFNIANLKLGLRLCIFVAAVVLVLAGVNYFTSPVIAEKQAAKGNVARAELVPEAENFVLYDGEMPEAGKNISEIYLAEAGNRTVAYCLNVTASGFGGDIELVIAIDENMKIRGVKTISHSETANIGAAALDEKGKLLPQYTNISVAATDGVASVSGATVTSKAVNAAVEEAVEVVKELEKGVGAQ